MRRTLGRLGGERGLAARLGEHGSAAAAAAARAGIVARDAL